LRVREGVISEFQKIVFNFFNYFSQRFAKQCKCVLHFANIKEYGGEEISKNGKFNESLVHDKFSKG